ncbi:MAG TPA: ABC transporter ATP-binding protein [Bacteroidales bacterium]|nr:ABC transporter ATP-binding protein [Bacteroidales bacterium]
MNFSLILKTFRILSKHRPGRLFLLSFLTLFQGMNTGFSIVLLIPLLQLLNTAAEGLPEGITGFFRTVSDRSGIPLSVETILIIYVIILSVNALVQYWKTVLDTGYQVSLIHDARLRLFRKVILADWPLLNSRSRTNHIQVLIKEIPVLANYYYYFLKLLTSLLMLAAFICYALMISAKFTFIVIFAGSILFFILRKFLIRSYNLGEAAIDSYNRLLKYIDDFWQSVKIAKVHSSEEFYYRKFNEANTSLLDIEYNIQKNYNLPQLIYRIAGILVLVTVIYAGYRTGDVPLAAFFILILLFAKIFPHFIAINNDVSMLFSYLPSVKLVFKLDDEFPDSRFMKRPVGDSLSFKKEIELKNISFSYSGGEHLFKNLNITIPANKITGITGVSGIGKTTLIDIISGLQKPVSGNIFIDGQILDEHMIPSWKSAIGYLPQDPFFIDGTIRENLVWDSNSIVSDIDIMKVLESVNAEHLVNRFKEGLDAFIVNYTSCFSGGECQRLALARVLIRQPGILLLDEATSSLDSDNEAIIMDVIEKISARVTVIFVTHRLSLIPYFNKIIKLT